MLRRTRRCVARNARCCARSSPVVLDFLFLSSSPHDETPAANTRVPPHHHHHPPSSSTSSSVPAAIAAVCLVDVLEVERTDAFMEGSDVRQWVGGESRGREEGHRPLSNSCSGAGDPVGLRTCACLCFAPPPHGVCRRPPASTVRPSPAHTPAVRQTIRKSSGGSARAETHTARL